MENVNFDKEMRKIIEKEKGNKPKLLLHSCCAPCSSYVLEYLYNFFDITLFYYNPNISPESEFDYRIKELEKFTENAGYNVKIIKGEYDSQNFYKITKGHETDDEGGERCFICYKLRLEKTALYAKENNFDYFTTTLSISPYKNSRKLNEIGKILSEQYGVNYLYSDFKKNNGYKRSIELSKEYNLYRQDYCGCIFSKAESEKKKKIGGKTNESNKF